MSIGVLQGVEDWGVVLLTYAKRPRIAVWPMTLTSMSLGTNKPTRPAPRKFQKTAKDIPTSLRELDVSVHFRSADVEEKGK
jgi:hypothetical protein